MEHIVADHPLPMGQRASLLSRRMGWLAIGLRAPRDKLHFGGRFGQKELKKPHVTEIERWE